MREPMGYIAPGVAAYPGERDGDLHIVECQDIPDEWVRRWRQQNERLRSERYGEVARIGTIPMIFVTKWLHEGLNIFKAPLREIKKKIYEEGVESFLVKRG
jgi:hypothetical protein